MQNSESLEAQVKDGGSVRMYVRRLTSFEGTHIRRHISMIITAPTGVYGPSKKWVNLHGTDTWPSLNIKVIDHLWSLKS